MSIPLTWSQNNPLHISLFSATGGDGEQVRDRLEYSFMLNSCLDIFEARMPSKTVGHDFGLLHALDDRTAMYGWLTNTGVKLVIVVDMEGRPAVGAEAGKTAILGLRNSDLTPVGRQLPKSIVGCANAHRIIGFPSFANSLHPSTSQPFLQSRRPRS